MRTGKSETEYLCLCKQIIEQQLGWAHSSQWKQRDFLNLISLLENRTGTVLSLSTIKRIWKADYRKVPHPATLDALARFAGYKNWLEFKDKKRQNIDSFCGRRFDRRNKGLVKTREHRKRLFQIKVPRVVVFFPLLIVLPVSVLLLFKTNILEFASSTAVFDPGSVEFFTSTPVSEGVPTTVIFHFDVSNVDADSFLVQQSWNMLKKDKIEKSDNMLTSVYFYPGVHKARIVANDTVLKEIKVRINTGDWLAIAKDNFSDDTPVYIRDIDILNNGKLKVTPDHLKSGNVEINRHTMVSYYYTSDFTELDSGNFTLEARLKADTIFNYTCPLITICVLGDGEMNYVPLTIRGCVGNSEIKMGDNIKTGLNHDMSALGVDVYDWQDIRIMAKNNRAYIHLNDKQVFEMPFSEDIGEISGININFTGTGSVDFVRLYNENNLLVYNTNFD